MELGDPITDERAERSALDVALDTLDNALNGLLDTVESGGLEQLNAAEKISFWQQFETFRNRLPLIDHSLIADAEASDLAGEYNFTNLTRFLMRIFLLSHSEAAARVRAAAAGGTPQLHVGGAVAAVAAQAGCSATRGCRDSRAGADCGTGHARAVPPRIEP